MHVRTDRHTDVEVPRVLGMDNLDRSTCCYLKVVVSKGQEIDVTLLDIEIRYSL